MWSAFQQTWDGSHPKTKRPYYTNRKHDGPRMFSAYEPLENVLEPARPGDRAKADPLFSWVSVTLAGVGVGATERYCIPLNSEQGDFPPDPESARTMTCTSVPAANPQRGIACCSLHKKGSHRHEVDLLPEATSHQGRKLLILEISRD